MNPVPASYHGVWQRTLLRLADGSEDTTTRVFWLQSEHLHADLRIPDPCPTLPRERIRLSGFAGLTEATETRCQWHRAIDFHPDSGTDIGNMRFINADEVHETALDDSYLEIWQRLPDSVGVVEQTWLHSADGTGRRACLLRAGDYFMFAADRPLRLSGRLSLQHYLQHESARDVDLLLGCELTFGRIQGGEQPWQILYSTLSASSGSLFPLPVDAQPWAELPVAALGIYPPENGWRRAPLPRLQDLNKEILV
ncbi:hypothetical protein ACS8E9_16365 [Pseudomonas neustonica]|uniref:hypothetical protein n=1 Tax=Pseudomonas TaxID=286 RepID=UPI0015F4C5A3|nr:hypothetical protein [Pseudomonas sp. 5Ae-yellow]MBA6420954.1 hypothetical protein [Pseudomonas sp. 5Ae-yellow]|tara:strand:+ start:1549 stop:2307 length:759 start_codon:yes stop_codon:yes gene_type:complete